MFFSNKKDKEQKPKFLFLNNAVKDKDFSSLAL